MRTRRSRPAGSDHIGARSEAAVLKERIPNTPKDNSVLPSLKTPQATKASAIVSPTHTDVSKKAPYRLPSPHYLLKSPSPVKSRNAGLRNVPPIQSTPLVARRRRRPMLNLRTPHPGLQDENNAPASKYELLSRPGAPSSRMHSPLPPSSPPSYIGTSTLMSKHLHPRQADTQFDDDDENKENINTDGVVISSSLVRRDDSDPFGFFALERKLKSMREQRVANKRRPLLSTAGPSVSRATQSTRRVSPGPTSPGLVLPTLDFVPHSPADEHDIDDMYAELEDDDDYDKENAGPPQPVSAAAPLIPLPVNIPSSSASELPNPLRTPHKRRRTYSTPLSSPTSSSPSLLASPSPIKPASPLSTAKKPAAVQRKRLQKLKEVQPDESPVRQASAEKRKHESDDEDGTIDPMAYSRNLEKLLPRRPAKRPARRAVPKAKGKGRARDPVSESGDEDEASEAEEDTKRPAKSSRRGQTRGGGPKKGRGRATKTAAVTTRATRSQVKGKAKEQSEPEPEPEVIDIEEDDVC